MAERWALVLLLLQVFDAASVQKMMVSQSKPNDGARTRIDGKGRGGRKVRVSGGFCV